MKLLAQILFLETGIRTLVFGISAVIMVSALAISEDKKEYREKSVLCSTAPIAKSTKDGYTEYVCSYKN